MDIKRYNLPIIAMKSYDFNKEDLDATDEISLDNHIFTIFYYDH